jgi:CheY-like chemotaxis protein
MSPQLGVPLLLENAVTADLTTQIDGRPLVLCVGDDAALLSYRAEVLKVGGFRVLSVCPAPRHHDALAQLCEQDLPVLALACHSLSREQRIAFARHARAACPGTKLLALTAGQFSADEAASYDVVLDSLDGPAALIKTLVAQL